MTTNLSTISSDILETIVKYECRIVNGGVYPAALMSAVKSNKMTMAQAKAVATKEVAPIKPAILTALSGRGGLGWMDCEAELDNRKIPGLAELKAIKVAWMAFDDDVAAAIHSGRSVAPQGPC